MLSGWGMVDSISRIRQLIAESKVFEAQRLIQAQLTLNETQGRGELLNLYLELLEQQESPLPVELLLECCDLNPNSHWLNKLIELNPVKFKVRILKEQIKIAEKKGQFEELHKLLGQYHLHLYEKKLPRLDNEIQLIEDRYFKGDFQLKLGAVALTLMRGDIGVAEIQLKELILSCVERSSPKGTKEKLKLLSGVLGAAHDKKYLILYLSYCTLAHSGISSPQDFKKLAELVIYFDDFKMQVLLMSLLVDCGLGDHASLYAVDVKANKDYDFVYLDKFFPHLKFFFLNKKKQVPEFKEPSSEVIDLTFEKLPVKKTREEFIPEDTQEQEGLLISTLKLEDYTVTELLELSISFLQSLFPKASAYAANKALASTQDPLTVLKASYLKATALLMSGDYRGVIDVTYSALELSRTKDDVLSFLYLQADVYSKLGQSAKSKAVLEKIVAIDSNYRMTRERLQRLDEI